ncbi:MAG: hypothetical protein CM15mP42_11160 [Methanobacteriota archaeon]|nr:MAG: hypothetical protein CM15mP42_11160 [Euryarchaeota archaeon]
MLVLKGETIKGKNCAISEGNVLNCAQNFLAMGKKIFMSDSGVIFEKRN